MAIRCIAALLITIVSPRAQAFVTSCHQGMTAAALGGAAWPMGAAPPPLAGDYAALPNELTLGVTPETNNLWALSALAGNLYTDLGPNDLNDVATVAAYAARPDLQREHCLRAPGDDGAAGDAQAVAACTAFIMDEVTRAIGDGDAPDVTATETVRMHLTFRGDVDIAFNRLGFHLGRASHALQDGFSHTFRSADKRLVKTVLNWVEWIQGGGYDQARDGFRHLYALDTCGSANDGTAREAAAQQATADLLAAVADDTGGRAGRLARASAVLGGWFGIQPDCTADNGWCDAPERFWTSGPTGCAVAGGVGPGPSLRALLAAGLMAWVARRRRRPRMLAAVLGGFAILAGGAPARAEDAARGEVKGKLIAKATPEEQEQLALRRFGVVVKGGIAIDNAGYDFGAGVRYDLSKRVTIGLDGEYNPWFSIETGKSVRGATNVFGVGIYRLDVRDYLELRLTLSAGVSILNFDTFAAPSGSVGPYFALSPLGVAIRSGSHLRFIVDPAEIVVPIPQTSGIPLIYRQHRFSIAVQANF